CFASGCAAMDAVLRRLRPGDHVIASNDLYGGSYRLFTEVYEPMGIACSFVDMSSMDEVTAAKNDNTKLLWIETPTNPLQRIVDIEELATSAINHDILSRVDNTC